MPKRIARQAATAAALLCLSAALCAQQSAVKVDHYTPADIVQQAASLKEKATSSGAAAATLEKYGVDFTMISVRTKDGGAELHENFADIFVIVEGEATLLSGGEIASQADAGPGEKRGSAVLHGASTHLTKGDIVHIPANLPHQLLLSKDSAGNPIAFTYFVIKVKERN